MTSGFNSNVRVGEIVYHVQTEQRGEDGVVIDTVVYISGRVIHRVRTNLRDDDARPNSREDESPTNLRDDDARPNSRDDEAQTNLRVDGSPANLRDDEAPTNFHDASLQNNLRAGEAKAAGSLNDSALQLSERVERQHQAVIAHVESGALRADAETAVAAAASAHAAAAKVAALIITPRDRGSWFAQAASAKAGDPAVAAIVVDVTFEDGTPATGAAVEARVEAGGVISSSVSASADAAGKAILDLPLNAPMPDAVFVVQAISGESRGELRFRLKARLASADPESAK
ncbi:MAG: hypothetical protein WA871_05155 [Candidatus Acidiferrales bacterium]